MKSSSPWLASAAGDAAARSALLNENLNLVHFVAKQLSRSLSADLDQDEMVNIGTLGLMAALESFDATRGLAFSTYAVPRIRGAILDELRRQDHVPRSIRRKSRDVSQARETLMRVLGRSPTEAEVARALDVDLETLWRWQAEMERSVHVSLDSTVSEADEAGPSPLEFLRVPGDAVDDLMEQEERVAALRDAILSLNPQQRTVVSLYYFEELNAREIADVLNISESRVSQIRARSLAALRGVLAPMRVSA